MTLEENELFLKRFVDETINGKNLDAIDELVAEDFVEHVPFHLAVSPTDVIFCLMIKSRIMPARRITNLDQKPGGVQAKAMFGR